MANSSILAAFERMWQHVAAKIGTKADIEHTHDWEDVSNIAGKNVEGQTFTVSGTETTASEGAEIFNNYAACIATGKYAHAEGNGSIATGEASHAENRSFASGKWAHAEGSSSQATGQMSHAEGYYCKATGDYSHAEGYTTEATNDAAHAEGGSSKATGEYSHAEGYTTQATGIYSHAEGNRTIAEGGASHAEGDRTQAKGDCSHAEGRYTQAIGLFQHVQGFYNILDVVDEQYAGTEFEGLGKYAHIVGNGIHNARSNAHTVDWNGNAWFSGNVYIGGTGQDDTNAKILATVDQIPTLEDFLSALETWEGGSY